MKIIALNEKAAFNADYIKKIVISPHSLDGRLWYEVTIIANDNGLHRYRDKYSDYEQAYNVYNSLLNKLSS